LFATRSTIAPGPSTTAFWQLLRHSQPPLPLLVRLTKQTFLAGGHEYPPGLRMAFALYEMKVVLSTLFTQVNIGSPPGRRSFPVRRGLTLPPDDGVELVVKQRLEGVES
jgi:hypothetical protein